jgi:hypothetical protein
MAGSHRFDSPDDHIRRVSESKEEYGRKRKRLTFEEKLRILVKLQEKAYFMRKTRFKPWPIEEKK